MKQKLLLTLLLIFTIKSFSQDSKFSLELNYPTTIDKNAIGENFNGIIDAGIKFKFAKLNPVNIGISFNSGILVNNSIRISGYQDFKATYYMLQPRLFAELNLESIKKIHPSFGLGYTYWIYYAVGTTNTGIKASDTSKKRDGINLNLGITYDITNRLFAQVQYDFIKFKVDYKPADIKYNNRANILKIGLGYRL